MIQISQYNAKTIPAHISLEILRPSIVLDVIENCDFDPQKIVYNPHSQVSNVPLFAGTYPSTTTMLGADHDDYAD
jgi:hypothetical protein